VGEGRVAAVHGRLPSDVNRPPFRPVCVAMLLCCVFVGQCEAVMTHQQQQQQQQQQQHCQASETHSVLPAGAAART